MTRKSYSFTYAALICLVTVMMATLGWSQDDKSTTTVSEPAAKPSPAQQEKSENTAKFEKKNDSKAETDIKKRLDASANVLDEIMATPDKGIPSKILGDAKCIAVIPSMVNIAVVFGGRHGKGVATCRTPNGWSAPAPITIAGGSWGLQIGRASCRERV